VRTSKPGHKLLELCAAFRFSAAWDSTLDVTLNGTDVSALGDQMPRFPRRWLSVAINLIQASAGNQPLSTGAAAYLGYTSIAFTQANLDRLARANTSLYDTTDIVVLAVARIRAANGISIIGNVTPFSDGVDLERSGASLNFRPFPAGNNIMGSFGTVAPQAWLILSPFNEIPQMTTNGAAYDTGTTARTVAAAATAVMTIGELGGGGGPFDMDWLFSAVAQHGVSPAVGAMLAFCARNKYGG
jgi:hypothetical protein